MTFFISENYRLEYIDDKVNISLDNISNGLINIFLLVVVFFNKHNSVQPNITQSTSISSMIVNNSFSTYGDI